MTGAIRSQPRLEETGAVGYCEGEMGISKTGGWRRHEIIYSLDTGRLMGDPFAQHVRVQPVGQRDGRHRYARLQAGGNDLLLEFGTAPPPRPPRRRFHHLSVHVSAKNTRTLSAYVQPLKVARPDAYAASSIQPLKVARPQGVGESIKVKTPCRQSGGGFEGESGVDLLSHTVKCNIIGAVSFHGPVRDGKGWDRLAMVIRHNLYEQLFPMGQQRSESGRSSFISNQF